MDTLAQRVAARYMREVAAYGNRAPVLPDRKMYVPPEARDEKPLVPEGTDLEIFTWDGFVKDRAHPESPGLKRFYGIAFAGKSNKPLWHYAFRTQSNRIEEIRKTIEIRKSFIERKQKELSDKANFQHGLKVGDVLYCSWGYDQTNIDFYQITEVRGKNVVLREIAAKVVDGEGGPSERVTAVPNHFVGEPMLKRPGGSAGSPTVKVHSFAYAHPWDGHPLHQTGAAYGH